MEHKGLMAEIVSWLFETGAIRVSQAEQPFWYTSGLIGPYYVNTHFLYGSEQVANELLTLIDETRSDPLTCTRKVRASLQQQYAKDPIFRQITDAIVNVVQANYDLETIDCVSGGERRDWFFSILPSELLGKPHLTIFKDRRVTLLDGEAVTYCSSLYGAKVLHISDLVTEASSYVRAWIPALAQLEASMLATLTIVDRCQGGAKALAQAQVPFQSLVRIDANLFALAAAQGYITPEQHELVTNYLLDPYTCMRQFLLKNKGFLTNALRSDGRTAERAKRLLAANLYNLPQAKLPL